MEQGHEKAAPEHTHIVCAHGSCGSHAHASALCQADSRAPRTSSCRLRPAQTTSWASFLGASSAAAVAWSDVGVWHTTAQASGADFRVGWLRTYLERPFARLRASPLLLLELLGLLFSEPCIWRLVANIPSWMEKMNPVVLSAPRGSRNSGPSSIAGPGRRLAPRPAPRPAPSRGPSCTFVCRDGCGSGV